MRKIVVLRRVLFDALGHFNNDDGWSMASHLAITALMALFPFLIFATTLASFLGAEAFRGYGRPSGVRHLARADRRADFPRGDQRADRAAQRPSDLRRAARRVLCLERHRGVAHLAQSRLPRCGDAVVSVSPHTEPCFRADRHRRLPGDQRSAGLRAIARPPGRGAISNGSSPIWARSRCGDSSSPRRLSCLA